MEGQTQAQLPGTLTVDLSYSSGSGTIVHYPAHPGVEKGWVPGKMGDGAGLERQPIAWPPRGTAHGCQSSLPQAADLFFLGISCFSVLSCVNKQQIGEQRQAFIKVWRTAPCVPGFEGGPS